MNNSSKSFLPALTGIRAIAAYLVFIYHFTPSSLVIGDTFHDFLHEMHIGVTMFFVLSGFIITYKYYDNISSIRKYFLNRFARIFPMYFILTCFTFLFLAIKSGHFYVSDLKEFLSCITFLKGFFPDLRLVGIGQGWTLTVEESFYLMAPLFFVLIKKSRLYLIIIPIVLILIGFAVVHFITIPSSFKFINSDKFMLLFTFFGRCFEFFVGIWIAIFFKKNLIRFRFLTLFGVISILVFVYILSTLKGGEEGIYHPLGIFVNNFVLPIIGIAPLYLGLLYEKTLFKSFLSSPLMVLLGKSSYMFYLIHLGIFTNLLSEITSNYFVIFIILNFISVLLFKYLEEPLSLIVKTRLINFKK